MPQEGKPNYAPFFTLFDVFPEAPQTPSELHKAFKEAKEALYSETRLGITQDEILFMTFIKRLSGIFDKAANMLAQEKFTIRFHGNPDHPFTELTAYEIIPLEEDKKKIT